MVQTAAEVEVRKCDGVEAPSEARRLPHDVVPLHDVMRFRLVYRPLARRREGICRIRAVDAGCHEGSGLRDVQLSPVRFRLPKYGHQYITGKRQSQKQAQTESRPPQQPQRALVASTYRTARVVNIISPLPRAQSFARERRGEERERSFREQGENVCACANLTIIL